VKSLNTFNFTFRHRVLLVLSLAFVLFANIVLSPSLAFAESKYASLIIDADTGTILHEENASELRYPASLVKMMTLYLAFNALENGKLKWNQRLKVSLHAANQSPSNLHLQAGDTITVEDAVLGVIIKSANDAAVVLGEAIGGSEARFADMMNITGKKLGMTRTNFENASGLPNLRQKTTAYDLARLAIALRRDFDQYYPLFKRASFTHNGRGYYTHNRVTKNYRGADGLKTGYIRASGFNLVTSARRNGRSLVGVVMGGQSISGRDRNMIKLLDAAFYQLSRGKSVNVASNKIKPAGAIDAAEVPVPEFKPGTKRKIASAKTKYAPPIPEVKSIDDSEAYIEPEADKYDSSETDQGGEN
jgi:D-alanyl-D-alanine carboxypeptidase